MSTHKDLPGGSQKWAQDVDTDRQLLRVLMPVVQRLAQNAGLDFSNPLRGINAGATPNIKNPVGQKLSSLADVRFYNVADGQVPAWSQKDQAWLPVTLPTPSAGGTVDISEVSYSGLSEGYGVVVDEEEFAYNAAGVIPNDFGPDHYNIENWTTGTQYIGVGDWNNVGMALITLDIDGFGRPVIDLYCEDYADGSHSSLEVFSYGVRVGSDLFKPPTTTTAARPTPDGLGVTGDPGCQSYDLDLGIPIWWNGTAWTNALGTPV